MLGHRQLTVQDVTGMIRRHIWYLVIPTILGCVGAYAVSLKLPSRYESKSLILVEGQKIPDTLVKSVINDDINSSLSAMNEEILSRSRLEPLIEKYGLFSSPDLTPEARVNLLAKAIQFEAVAPMTDSRSSKLPGFRIIVTLSDARKAQQVCSDITSMFIEEDLKNREQESDGATQFMEKQVADAQQKMNDQDGKLAAFKRAHFGSLPDEEQTNLGLLTSASTQLQAISQAIDRDQGDKSILEGMLSTQISEWKSAKQTGVSNPDTMESDLDSKQKELAALQDKYGDNFPAVKEKKEEVEELKQKIADANAAKPSSDGKTADGKNKSAETAPAASGVEPPSIQQLRAQIASIDLSIKERQKAQKTLQQQYDTYQAKIQMGPLVEQEYKELTRDSATAQADYNDLLHRRDESAMSADLERRQQGEHFSMLDSASMPESPSFPIRWEFAVGGLGGGLALGAGLLLLMEMRDKSLRTESDVEILLKLPTLVMVPSVDTQSGIASRVVFRLRRDNKTLPAGG